MPKTALIIGASRGLGLALVQEYLGRGWDVIATIRGETPAALHAAASDHLTVEHLDINDPAGIEALRARLEGQTIDLLFVNAGISNGPAERLATTTADEFTRVMLTNAFSPMKVVEALHHLVPSGGSIAAMSSGLGSVADNERGGWEVYRASKAALNTLMRSFAASHKGDGRSLFVLAPGWVRTDMGGPDALLSIEESIPRLVDTIQQHAATPGLQYLNYQGQTVRW
jgi:NAD(P)-dependent dehydrogenase (short-subunit alcohol dehydrogenase family)